MLDFSGIFEGASVFIEDDNKTGKSMIRRLSIGGTKRRSKHKKQLDAVVGDAKGLKEEISTYSGDRSDRRYSQIQSKLVQHSFLVENLRKSFKQKKDKKKLDELQEALSICIRALEERVDSSMSVSVPELETTEFETDSEEDSSLVLLEQILERLMALARKIEAVENFDDLLIYEEEVDKLADELTLIPASARRKSEVLKYVTRCRDRIVKARSSNNANKLRIAFHHVQDNFNMLGFEMHNLLKEGPKTLKDERVQEALCELRNINHHVKELQLILKN